MMNVVHALRSLISGLVVVVALTAFRPAPAHSETKSLSDVGPRVRQILGDEAADLVVRARRAEVFELEERGLDDPPPVPKPGVEVVSGHATRGKGRPLDKLLFEAFRAAILNSNTYTYFDLRPGTGVGKGCGGFRPGVAVRFWSERRGGRRHVDALLCFNCDDIAVVSDRPGLKIVEHDMSTGVDILLPLASAAIPESAALAARMADHQENAARTLFEAMLPARTQAVFAASPAMGPPTLEEESKRLVNTMPGKDLVTVATRAFGFRRQEWLVSSVEDELVVGALKRVSAADVRAAFKAISSDQMALAGAAELLVRDAFATTLSVPERDALLPKLCEAAVVQMPRAEFCPLMAELAARGQAAGLRVLEQVATGELHNVSTGWPAYLDSPSARACALLALAENDPKRAQEAALGWKPANQVEQAALGGVRLFAGDESALDASLVGVHSHAIAKIVVRYIQQRPTRSILDRVVAILATHPEAPAPYRIEELMSTIAGQGFGGYHRPEREVAERITAWWRSHRETWQPRPPRR